MATLSRSMSREKGGIPLNAFQPILARYRGQVRPLVADAPAQIDYAETR